MIFIFLCFGMIIGSFLGVIIERFPKGENFVTGRSRCSYCHRELNGFDLIPVISFAAFGGRCRYCHQRLSWRYPLLELACGLVFSASYAVFGFSFYCLISILLGSILIIVAFIDYDTMIINDRFHFMIIGLGILQVVFMNESWTDHLFGALLISVPFLILALITNGLGGGDVKLMASGGFLLGMTNVFVAFIISSLLGGVYAAIVLILKKKDIKAMIPFGPFLCIGLFLAYLIGTFLFNSYLGLFS